MVCKLIKIYREIFNFFFNNLKAILLITAIVELPLTIINNTINTQAQSSIFFLLIALHISLTAISNGAFTILFKSIIDNSEINIKDCINSSLKFLPRMASGLIIYGLCIMSGLFFLVIPGIILGARLSLYNYFIIYENMTPIDALKQSFMATTGYTTEITSLFIIMLFIVTAPYLLVTKFIMAAKLSFPGLLIVSDFVFSVIGSLMMVFTFRIYCIIKSNGKLSI